MAKRKDKPDDDLAMEHLLDAMSAPNATFSPGVENARLDAAELILKLWIVGQEDAKESALNFLRRAIVGGISSLGASHRARAAGILIRSVRGVL